jgi:hypothetical protein
MEATLFRAPNFVSCYRDRGKPGQRGSDGRVYPLGDKAAVSAKGRTNSELTTMAG